MTLDRLPPHDIEAEQAVLGSILIDHAVHEQVRKLVGPADFYREIHAQAFRIADGLWIAGERIDQVTVGSRLQMWIEKQQSVGTPTNGHALLANLAARTPTSVHAEHYAGIVKRLSSLRRTIRLANDLATAAFDPETDPLTLAQNTVTGGLALMDQQQRSISLRTIREATDAHFDSVHEAYMSGFANRGTKIGISTIDRMTGGFERGMLTVIGARPSVGKTQTMLTMARNVAERGGRVAYFSLEQTEQSMIMRLVAQVIGVDVRSITAEEREALGNRFAEAYGHVSDLPIWIAESAGMTTGEMHAQMLGYVARVGRPDLVVCDYLQLLKDPPLRIDTTRDNLVSRMTANLKGLARAIDAPVLVACQLNREVEKRPDKRPNLSDLRESGSIEQDADIVMLLYRHDYYVQRGQAKDEPSLRDVLEVNIAKHRDGPTGKVNLYYHPKTGRIGAFEVKKEAPQ